jgi:hypothetical protein
MLWHPEQRLIRVLGAYGASVIGLACCVFFAGSFSSELLFATTLPSRTLVGLSQEAHLIVRGTVQKLLEGPEPLSTTVVISVQQSWKDKPASPIKLIQPEGTRGNLTAAVPGLPSFRLGEDVLVFLIRNSENEYEVLHGKQGKLRVRATRHGSSVLEDSAGRQLDLTETLTYLSSLPNPAAKK